jgi:sulfoxide reductase heme-binding subunit YedZ
MSSGSALWYLSRGTGVVSLVLLTVVIVLGVLTRGGRPLPGLPRFAVAGLHRNASLLAVAFLAVHIATAVLDPYVTIGWLAVLVPFVSSYQPVWVGLGALALDLMLAAVVTSLLRQRIGRRVWRAIHLSVYASWPVALLHSFTLGPDVQAGFQLWLAVLCVATTTAAIGWRVVESRQEVMA